MQKIQWINSEKYKGIRWYCHDSRKHGVHLDKCFGIRYQVGGKRIESILGWASCGMTEKKAMLKRERYIENYRKGEGPVSQKEENQISDEKRKIENEQKKALKKEALTFEEFFKDTYQPILETSKKSGSVNAEKILFEKWLKPVIGKMAFKEIVPLHFEKIKKNMLKKQKAPRSIEYALAVARQIWNMAQRDGITDKESPTREVKKPKIDNKRVRFLTHDEADRLLEHLSIKSQQVHDMALLSLHTGMRASEIFSLSWSSIHTDTGIIDVFDAKGGSRQAHMTKRIKEMFLSRDCESPNNLVFKDRNGKQIKQASNTFERTVDDLDFNKSVTDHRQKVLFHTLRHTYASWLVQQGEPLYTVQKLMGHASIAMTERYSHLAPDNLKSAVKNFEKNINVNQDKKAVREKNWHYRN
ncbi:MAG: site-specific integrase [Deltaproteobacteria bacterium]|nr:site-specific integrase [Deltaproteobacteria bacterium]